MALSGFVIRILLLAIPGILGSKLYKKLRGRPVREMWEGALEIMIFSLAAYSLVHLVGLDTPNGGGQAMIIRAIPPFTVQSLEPIPFVGPPAFSIPATQPTTFLPQVGQAGKAVAIQVTHPITIATTQPVLIDGSPTSIAGNQSVTIQPAVTGMPSSSIFEAFTNEQVAIGGYVGTICFASTVAVVLAFLGSYVHKFSLVNQFGRLIGASNRAGDEDAWTFFNNSDQVEWVFVRDLQNNRVYYGSIGKYSDSDKSKEIVLNDVQVFTHDTDELLYCVEAIFLSRDHDNWTIEVPPPTANNPPAPEIAGTNGGTAVESDGSPSAELKISAGASNGN